MNLTDTSNSFGGVACDGCPIWYDLPWVCHADSSTSATARIPSGIFSIACAGWATALACMIKCRYNHVLVFHRRIHTTLVSNTWWMIFMLSLAMESVIASVRILLGMPMETADESLFYAQMIVHGFSATALCVAVDYQHRYRSSHGAMVAPKAIALHMNSDSPVRHIPETHKLLMVTPDVRSRHSIRFSFRQRLTARLASLQQTRWVLAAFLLAYLSIVVVNIITHENTHVAVWAFLGSNWLLLGALGFVTHAVAIIATDKVHDDGPNSRDKALLVAGVGMYTFASLLPPSGWKYVLPQQCVADFLSVYDMLEIVKMMSCTLLYEFMKREYRRSKETCIYTTVHHIQQSWHYRHF
eukprot:m.387706 g.387706  ORF g.387706 m.387706 type:complete len:355 (-) comp21035_c0_seq6:183-1247(-)